MQTTEYIWMDGKLTAWDEAKIHVLTHTLHYGGGAFEGIRFYETERGPAIFRLSDHVERLLYSASVLKMSVPYSKDELCNAIIEVTRVNKLTEGYIRPIIFYGYGKMGVNPVGAPVQCAIACWPWGAYLPHAAVDIKTTNLIRIHPRSTKIEAKLCGHYLNGILATLELKGTNYHEVLFLDEQEFISEGAGENFFMVKSGIIYTPKLGTILPGITRETVMEVANQLKINIMEKDISLQEAYAADGAFFTGTAAEVTPIRSIDDKVLGEGVPDSITLKIKEVYHEIVRGKEPNFLRYLTFVK